MIENMICSFFGTLAFSIVFNVHKRFYFCCGLTGMVGWLCYCMMIQSGSAAMASFFGTIVVVLLSRIFAVWKKCPITVFLVSGIFPLVPGAGVYYTAYYFVTNSLQLASQKGLESLKVAFAIALGIVFVVSIPKKWFQISYWRNRKNQIVNEMEVLYNEKK